MEISLLGMSAHSQDSTMEMTLRIVYFNKHLLCGVASIHTRSEVLFTGGPFLFQS